MEMDVSRYDPVALTRIVQRKVGWWWPQDANTRQQAALHRRGEAAFMEPVGHSVRMGVDALWRDIRDRLHAKDRGGYSLVARIELTPQRFRVDLKTTAFRVIFEDRRHAAIFRFWFGEWEA